MVTYFSRYKNKQIWHSHKSYNFVVQDRMIAMENWSSDTQEQDFRRVVDAYLHAAMSLFPKYRYVVGKDCWLWPGYIWVSYMPEFLQDLWAEHFLMRNMAKPQACK